MNYPVLYRKRFIPDECVKLKDDEILKLDDSVIITKWKALKKRCDISSGYSCYYLKDGYKVSKFLKEDNSLLCWYFDIITYDRDTESNTLTVIDLLADVIIYPDGKMKIDDLDELSEAFEKKLIDESLLKKSLLSLNRLLNEIYENGISSLTSPIENIISGQDQ
ncbi:MAG: DUF402 domain-containing protein [Butyrivibrio sp.]|nr:DUF402 domain-containing protein [Butyrivibrio sp.]